MEIDIFDNIKARSIYILTEDEARYSVVSFKYDGPYSNEKLVKRIGGIIKNHGWDIGLQTLWKSAHTYQGKASQIARGYVMNKKELFPDDDSSVNISVTKDEIMIYEKARQKKSGIGTHVYRGDKWMESFRWDIKKGEEIFLFSEADEYIITEKPKRKRQKH